MRRLNTLELILVGVASLFLVASGYLFWSYRQVVAEQADLEFRVSRPELEAQRAQDAQQQVARLREDLARLEAQLASPPEIFFPKTVSSVDAFKLISIDARVSSGLERVDFSFQGVSPSWVGTRNYLAHRFNIRARGQLYQISAYLKSVEEGANAPLVTRNIVVVPTEDKTAWSLSAEVIVYAQPPG